MLDRANVDQTYVQVVPSEWHALSSIEQRLVALYRQLSEEDRKQLRRLTEALASIPDDSLSGF
ncbi:hypothetical protein BJN42_23785 [Pseudomonas koreensis]|nr:hypothetical protein BJN42_23785 [Pseudomonas koreensis]